MLGGNGRKLKEAPLVAVFAADLEPSKRVPAIQAMMHAAEQSPTAIQQLPSKLRFFGGEGYLSAGIRCLISSSASPIMPVPSYTPTIAWSYKSTMFAVSQYVYAAESHGIGTAIMEGFDEIRLRHLLDIPDRYSVPVVIACGYPASEDGEDVDGGQQKRQTPRLPLEELFFDGTFGQPFRTN
jgi:nitroreductase